MECFPDMDFSYQSLSQKVVPKMWSAECREKKRKWEEEPKTDGKKLIISTNGYKIQKRKYKKYREN